MRAILLCSAVMVVLAGCGGSPATKKPSAGARGSYNPSAAAIPACAHAGKAIELPAGFPTDFPFPHGSAITRTKIGYANAVEVFGFVPELTFKGTVNYIPDGLKHAGYRMRTLEADPPNDSEGEFVGKGLVGTYRLVRVATCPGVMQFQSGIIKVK